jgi:PAS domain-containing protein
MSKKPTYEELEQRVRELESTDIVRKQTENALRKNEREYRSTVDGLLVGVVVHDTDTRILISNQEASNIVGQGGNQF